MVKITDESRELINAPDRQYFSEGVHEVVITGVKRGESTNGTPRLEVTVTDAEGKGLETTVMMYMSEKAYPYTLRTIQGILVHNEKTEEAKGKIRAYFANLDDTDKLQLTKLTMAQCWLKVEKNGQQYQNKDGEMKDSYDSNLFSWEPTWTPSAANTNIKASDFPISGATPSDMNEVPFA